MLKKIIEERRQKHMLIEELKKMVPEIPTLKLQPGTGALTTFTFALDGEWLNIQNACKVNVSNIPKLITFLQEAIGDNTL